MSNEVPKAGSSKEHDEESSNQAQSMTLSDYLALPENRGANIVQPLQWCPHLESVTSDSLPTNIDVLQSKCEECENVGENWICLVCLSIHCSRYVKEHMLIHGTSSEHPIALSFSDISVWCYICDDYIDNSTLYKFKNAIHKSKFGENMPCPKGNEIVELQMH